MKPIPALLRICSALVLSGWVATDTSPELLSFTYLCRPACPVVDDFGLGLDEHVFPAAFVFLEKPSEVSEPCESSDFFDVIEQAGVFVVLSPASSRWHSGWSVGCIRPSKSMHLVVRSLIFPFTRSFPFLRVEDAPPIVLRVCISGCEIPES